MRAHDFLPKKLPQQKQPARWHAGEKAILFVGGVACKCVGANKFGYVLAPVGHLEDTFPVSIEEFNKIKDQHSFRFEKERMPVDQSLAILAAPVQAMMDLPKEKRDYVKWQIDAIRKFIAMEADGSTSRYGPSLEKALRKIQRELSERKTKAKRQRGGRGKAPAHKLVGPKQFLIWVDNFLKLGAIGLLPHYHENGRHGPRYTNDEYAKLFEYVAKYLKPEPPSVASLHRDMGTEIAELNVDRERLGLPLLRVPGKTLLGEKIAEIDKFDVMAAHDGVPYAVNYFRAARGGVPDLVRPLQRVEADEWRTHLNTLVTEMGFWGSVRPELQAEAEKTRVWVAAAQCSTTRVIPALIIAPCTGAQNTLMLLRMMFMDKTALGRAVGAETPWEYRGSPDLLVTDGGSSNVNDDVEFACSDLGITFKVPQGEKPTQRGKIERFFRTIDIRAIFRFSGRTFSNPVKKGKYDALARACVTVDELCALLVRFILDEYHNTEHGGLCGEAPRQVWLRASKKCPPTLPPDRSKIRTTFGEDMKATLGPSGIRVFGNSYWTPSVQKIFEQRGNVEDDIRVDTEDLAAISLKQVKGWLTVKGPDVMDGVSVQVWQDAQADLRRQNFAFKEMVRPVVQRAIRYAMDLDIKTRARLLIRYRPMTGEDFEVARKQLWINVPNNDELDPAPETQPDLFGGKVKVGTRPATPRASAPTMPGQPEDDAATASGRAAPNPPKTRNTTKRESPPATRAPARKPTRPWTIKDRKR
jgi:putative transposase